MCIRDSIYGIRIDYLSPTFYLFDLVCLLTICLNLRKRLLRKSAISSIFNPKLVRNGLTIILFISANIIFSIQPELTALKILKFATFIYAGFVVANYSFKINFRPMILGFLMSTSIVLLLAILQFFARSSIGGIWYFLGERAISISLPSIAKMSIDGHELLRPYSTFSHPNSMGGFYLILYFLIDWMAINYFRDDEKPLASTIKIFAIGIMILSFSKTVVLAFGLISIFTIFKSKPIRACTLCNFARVSIIFLLIFFIFLFDGDRNSLPKRVYLARHSIEVFQSNILTGSGVSTSLISQSKITGVAPGAFTDSLQPVHNIFLLFLSETGLLGVVFLVTMIWNSRPLFHNVKFIPLRALSGIALTGMLDHYWITIPQNIALLGFAIAISIHILKSDDQLELPLWKS